MIFENELLELDDDGFLAGEGFGGVFCRSVIVGGGACLLEEPDDLLHVLLSEPVENRADGAEDFDVFALDAVAVELGDDGFELVADAFGGGFKLLLFEFLLENGIGLGAGG